MDSFEKVKIAVKAIDSKRGFDIDVIKVRDLTVVTDYFVICTTSSSTQLRAVTDEVEFKLKEAGVMPLSYEGKGSQWYCLDYADVVVHIFYKDQREFYQLEHLWEDGEKVDIEEYIIKE